MEAWEAAQALRSEGADIRAVTVWALLGLMDWDSLLRKRRGHYEPGAFDASQKPPRPTLLADAVASLARNGYFSHGALEEPGWWRRSDRVHAKLRRHKAALVVPNGSLPEARTGASGGVLQATVCGNCGKLAQRFYSPAT